MAPTIANGEPVAVLELRERYYTTEQLAAICEDENGDSIRQLRKIGVIAPELFKGLHQYHVSASFRVTAFRALQRVLGKSSPIPLRVINAAGARIDELCKHEAVYAADYGNALSTAIMKT